MENEDKSVEGDEDQDPPQELTDECDITPRVDALTSSSKTTAQQDNCLKENDQVDTVVVAIPEHTATTEAAANEELSEQPSGSDPAISVANVNGVGRRSTTRRNYRRNNISLFSPYCSPPASPDIAMQPRDEAQIANVELGDDTNASTELPENDQVSNRSNRNDDIDASTPTLNESSTSSFDSDNSSYVPPFSPRSLFSDLNSNSTGSDYSSIHDDEMETEDLDDLNGVDTTERANTISDIVNKEKPKYTWNSTYELMRREHGLAGNERGFSTRFYSSRHNVERMKLSHRLTKHNGCVNCLNFNRDGDLLCSGSDDMRIIVWGWAQNKPNRIYKSGHTENVFQTKFIESAGCLDIVSASRDGQVRRSIIPPSGGKPHAMCLYRHRGAVHKIVTCPQNPYEIISVGEDAFIRQMDLRGDEKTVDMLKVEDKHDKKIRLFSISHHPLAPEIVVCGCDNFVRVYDKRNMNKTVHLMCPEKLLKIQVPQITCCVYNNTGSEILASYSDEHIYLFNNNCYKSGEYLHQYRGHYNHRTIKGVNFFGPKSEYVISGSDCGNLFFWDKNTESILNFMNGDTVGVVNCMEPHPSIPVLATSGLDHNVKIWTPHSEIYPPDLSKLANCVKRNLMQSINDERDIFDSRQFNYFIRQFANRRLTGELRGLDNSDTPTNSSSSSNSGSDAPQDTVQCRQQ